MFLVFDDVWEVSMDTESVMFSLVGMARRKAKRRIVAGTARERVWLFYFP